MAGVNYSGGKVTRTPLEYLEVSCKVVSGDYGNGSDRQEKLKAEGYNYNKVQQIINEAYKEERK